MTVHPFPHRVKTPPQGAARFFEYMRAIEASSLPMTERHIAITIARFAGDRVCYASNATLATACGCTPRTIQRATNSLVSAGWLDLTNKAGASNAYGIPATLPVGGDSVSPHDSVSPPPMTLCHPPHDSVSQGGDSVSPYIPKTSPETSPPIPSREGAHETTPAPATSQEDGMGGDRQDIKGHDSTPPRPCLPLGCAPGRPPESERGAEMMTADELHAEVVKAQRARAAAKVSPQVGWRRGDLPYLARTFTRWELMRALRVVADAKIKDPAKTLRLALEGEWSFPGAGARQAHAPAPSPIPRPLPLIEVERPREHTADERADIERARQLAAAHRARALMLIGGAR